MPRRAQLNSLPLNHSDRVFFSHAPTLRLRLATASAFRMPRGGTDVALMQHDPILRAKLA